MLPAISIKFTKSERSAVVFKVTVVVYVDWFSFYGCYVVIEVGEGVLEKKDEVSDFNEIIVENIKTCFEGEILVRCLH